MVRTVAQKLGRKILKIQSRVGFLVQSCVIYDSLAIRDSSLLRVDVVRISFCLNVVIIIFCFKKKSEKPLLLFHIFFRIDMNIDNNTSGFKGALTISFERMLLKNIL